MADRARRRISDEQLEMLLEIMASDNKFLLDSTPRTIKRKTVANKWKTLAMKLNAVENGAIKSVPKWQQFWRDWKLNIKRKVRAEGRHNLNKLETQLIKLIDYEHNNINFGKVIEYWFNSSHGNSPRVQVAEYILDEDAYETDEQLRRRNLEVDVGKTIDEIVSRQNMENALCERGRREGVACIRFVYVSDS